MQELVKDRLIAYLKSKGISNTEFGRRIGVSSAYISSMRKSLQPDKAEKIAAAFPDLNLGWLLTGEGEMLKATYTQTVHGGENFTQTGNISVIPSELLGKALDEIAEMRRALTQALALNQQHTSRLMAMLERLNPPANPLNRP